eukprot:5624377-Alexandrium_andersonii.AAC.1
MQQDGCPQHTQWAKWPSPRLSVGEHRTLAPSCGSEHQSAQGATLCASDIGRHQAQQLAV